MKAVECYLYMRLREFPETEVNAAMFGSRQHSWQVAFFWFCSRKLQAAGALKVAAHHMSHGHPWSNRCLRVLPGKTIGDALKNDASKTLRQRKARELDKDRGHPNLLAQIVWTINIDLTMPHIRLCSSG